MSFQATHDDANLILRLYELRRDEKLRQARDWFGSKFNPSSLDEMMKLAPIGSQENAYVRMVTSYWEMAASFVTSGVLNQDLFLQSNGELMFVWERLRPVVPELRGMMKNPTMYQHMETLAGAFEQKMKQSGPEAYAAFQALVARVAAAGK